MKGWFLHCRVPFAGNLRLTNMYLDEFTIWIIFNNENIMFLEDCI